MPTERLGNLLNPKEIEGLEQILERTNEIARLTCALAENLGGALGASIVSAAVDKSDSKSRVCWRLHVRPEYQPSGPRYASAAPGGTSAARAYA